VTLTSLKPTVRCTSGHFMHPGDTTCGCGAAPRVSTEPLPHHDTAKACEIAAARASMAAVALHLPVSILRWNGHADGTATQLLDGDTVLRYQPYTLHPFAAATPCLHGAHHYRTIRSAADLVDAIAEADACIEQHADFTGWATAAARDLTAAFAPRRAPGTATVTTLCLMRGARV
jgi:hypothetical protein